MGFLTTIFATVITILLVYIVTKLVPYFYKRWQWRRKLDPHFAHWPISWITGSLHHFSSLDEFFKKSIKFAEDGHKAYVWWIGPLRCIIGCLHPDNAKVLLRSSEPKARGGGGYEFLKPWIGDGLLVSDGKKWERNRRLLTPGFHFEILHSYLPIYNRVVEVFMNKMEKQSREERYVEVHASIVVVTLDTMLRCTLSYEDNIQEKGDNHPYLKAVQRLGQLIIERAFNPFVHFDFTYALTKKGKENQKLCNYVHDFAMQIITSRKKKLKADKQAEKDIGDASERKKHLDFLDILLTARDEEGRGLTDREIRDEVDTFMFAGHDTTSTVLGWCLYALGTHQEIQQRVFEDIHSVMGDRTEVMWDDLSKFQYLPLFIKETMRLYTPVPVVSREVTSTIVLNGVEIPKGVMIDIPIYQLHNNPCVWDQPKQFRPERFEKDAFAARDPYLYVPFSAGPRNCIGQNFAMNEIKTMVARIVHRFHLEADPDIDPYPYPEVVLRAKNGIHIKFTSR